MTRIVNKMLVKGAAVAVAVMLSATPFAADSEESSEPAKPARSGEELSQACAACHGAEGIAISDDFPNIAGQYKSYLLYSLKGYRSGERNNAIMQSFVKDLTDEELENLAEYYSSFEGLEVLERD